jgi:hypothetical protein
VLKNDISIRKMYIEFSYADALKNKEEAKGKE